MAKIVLLSCVSKKLKTPEKARNFYTSSLFKKSLKYAQSLNPDKIFILSAKYGLISLEDEIENYNLTLNSMKKEERKVWAGKVLEQLKHHADLKNDEFVFLARKKYREFLAKEIKNYKIPMQNLGIGKQLKFLGENVE